MADTNKTESIEDIYLQQKLLEAAARLHYEVKDQKALDMLVFVAKQCMPQVFETVIKEYQEQRS